MIRSIEKQKIDSFNSLYRLTYGRLYTVFIKISKDTSLTKDVLQQTYIKVWEKWDDLTNKDDLYPLLYTYSKNIYIDELRKGNHRRNAEKKVNAVGKPQQADELYIAKETKGLIASWVSVMPARRKEVFLLSREVGCTHKQIAEDLSLSPHTIERHVQEALIDLKKKIKPASVLIISYVIQTFAQYVF